MENREEIQGKSKKFKDKFTENRENFHGESKEFTENRKNHGKLVGNSRKIEKFTKKKNTSTKIIENGKIHGKSEKFTENQKKSGKSKKISL